MEAAEKVAAARAALRDTANENGGPYEEPAVYRGSCARTMFDRPGSADGTVTVLLPEGEIGGIRREAFVRIDSVHPRTGEVEAEYIGTVTAGPFAEPDVLGAASPTLVVATAHGAVLTPRYHGIAEVTVIGERVDGATIPAARRPCPNSPVFLLAEDDVRRVLGVAVEATELPFRLGLLDTGGTIEINIPAAQKSVLFKHAAILGTTGGGKSTTVSGTVVKLAEAGNAVLVFDIEGEYASIHKPADNPRMLAALAKRGLEPAAARRSRLFHLAGRKPADPSHPEIRAFRIPFDALSPYVLAEILELSEPQERRLMDAYEVCRMTMERARIFPATPEEQQRALDVDELVQGWPRMTLTMMIDTISAAIESIDGDLSTFGGRPGGFKGQEPALRQALQTRNIERNSFSWKAIAKRLWRMEKAGVFARSDAERIDMSKLVEPGVVSIVDLSDMDAPYLRNLVISQMLRAVQDVQDERYRAAEADPSRDIGRVNIFIEEAHEFLSVQRIRQMPNLFDQVARIARRGRKRYLGLVFVTQLPGHLPDEVLGLVNNWILHKLTDDGVIARLRKVVSGISAATWAAMPNLAPGQAVCSFAHLTRPVLASIDPSPCRLRMVD